MTSGMFVVRCFLLFIICIGVASAVVAQHELSDWQSAANWGDGIILTKEEQELKGKVRYDDLQCILFFRDGKTDKTFSARQVKMFSVRDSVRKTDRIYYSLEFEDRKLNIRQPMFFELIKEFKSFAVLTKVDPVQFNQAATQPRGTQNSNSPNGVMRVQQFETICFISSQGLIEPYLEMEITIKNGIFQERIRNRQSILNKNLFKKYFGEKANNQIMTFVKHNELQLNSKEDFLKILDYYEKYLVN